MNSKTLKTLGLVTLAIAVAAVAVALRSDRAAKAADEGGALLFPELAEHINDVAAIEVVRPDASFELEKTGDEWGMPSKGGFPANFDTVRKLVVEISKLEKLEPKTKLPENYARLGVEDVAAEGSESTLVRLAAADGRELAALILGDTYASPGGAGEPALYVRRPGDAQAWLVEGRVWVEPTAGQWLEKSVAEIAAERVARAVTTHPDAEVVRFEKQAPEDAHWSVPGVPEGRELSWEGAADAIPRALSRLSFQDVKPAAEVDFGQAPNTVTEFETWDGLRVTARAMDSGEESYLALSAAYDPALRREPMGPELPAESAEEPAEETGETAEPAPPALKSPEDVQAEVEELNARWSSWVYVVPGYTASNFKKRVSELLKPLPTPGEEGEGEAIDMSSLEELFPDGLPPELQGIDFGAGAQGEPEAPEAAEECR